MHLQRLIPSRETTRHLAPSSSLAALRVVASELKVATFSVSWLCALRANRTVSLLLALRAAVLRLAVSWLTLPSTAATSALAATLRPCCRRFQLHAHRCKASCSGRGLTLPSRGQPPAGGAQALRLRCPRRGLPLMSNVRHRKAPVLQDRALKARSSMPVKRSLIISTQLNKCELVVEAKHWQNIEQTQCTVATPLQRSRTRQRRDRACSTVE